MGYDGHVSTIDQVLERVSTLDEPLAAALLAWLDRQQIASRSVHGNPPLGARAMIGFAMLGGRAPRTTENWMRELREGDSD